MLLLRLVLYFLVGFCFVFYTTTRAASTDDIEGYYWRHYSGNIPRDVLLGGQDEAGNPTYIGQTVHRDILVPGYINQEEQQMYYEWGNKEHKTKKNIKILCTQHPEQFEWIRTSIDDIGNLTEKNFVYGGFELDYTVYIGRVQVNEELAVGKVIITNKRARGLHTTSNGTFVHLPAFEVLNYEPDIPYVSEIRKSLSQRAMYYTPNSSDHPKFGFYIMFLTVCFLVFT